MIRDFSTENFWNNLKSAINPANDNFLFVQEAGNHGARIALLPTTERDNATAILKRWAGVVAKRAPETVDEPEWVEPRRPR